MNQININMTHSAIIEAIKVLNETLNLPVTDKSLDANGDVKTAARAKIKELIGALK